jgi:hypothetical protein
MQKFEQHRREFLGTAASAMAAAQIGSSSASAGPHEKKAAVTARFPSLRQINAGLLRVGYAELGPEKGPAAILLHGWPYDIHSYVEVAPLLASSGYRVIVPYLRGYGTTQFLSKGTIRNGQQSVVAVDVVALMDALRTKKQSSPASIGARARPTSLQPSGRSGARPWCRSAAI